MIYAFSPFATLIFSANDIPEIEGESNAFVRRFKLTEWDKAFYSKDRDRPVKTIRKNPCELSDIFNHSNFRSLPFFKIVNISPGEKSGNISNMVT